MASDFLVPSQPVTYIHSCVITLSVTCKCGAPKPILVVFMPGVPLKAYCENCKTVFMLGRLNYDLEKGEHMSAGLIEQTPLIETPPAGFKVQ